MNESAVAEMEPKKVSDSEGPAAIAWGTLQMAQRPYLSKAQEVSSLTIPFLIPPDGATGSTELPTPYQGVGAEGVNNLASKFVLTLFPPSGPFFRLVASPSTIRELGEEEGADPEKVVEEFNARISVMEQEIQAEIESKSLRPLLFTCFRHLIVGGNYLIRWQNGKPRGFGMPHFRIKRDRSGTILWIITREVMTRSALPDGVTAPKGKDSVELFTAAHRQPDGTYRLWEEVGKRISNKDTVTEDKLPYIAPTLFDLDGESYGHGLGEHYLGDLVSLEALRRAGVLGSAAASHILFLVNPNGFTKVSDLQGARTGSYVPGLASDVEALQLNKNGDFAFATSLHDSIERKLYRVFLLATAVQRDAERVTKAEIQFMAQEIEATHGGTYSLMTTQLQLPLARMVMADMVKADKLPELPEEDVIPKVITGLEGLGRSAELDRLRTMLSVAVETLGVELVTRRIKPGNILTRLAASTGVDSTGMWFSDEEIAQQDQQAQQRALLEKLGPPAVGGAAGPLAQNAVETLG
jgi:hypothetical protein